jgi:hypothetical protein
MARKGGKTGAKLAWFLSALFFLFILPILPALALDSLTVQANDTSSGVQNIPPTITEVVSTNAIAGRDASLIAVIFDPNGAADICPRGGCNIICAYAEIITDQTSGRETLSCRNQQCSVLSQFQVLDPLPVWDPKTSRLSAKIPFGISAKEGKWDCTLTVSDGAGAIATRTYPMVVHAPTFFSRLVDQLDTILFIYLLPATIFLTIFLAIFRFLSGRFRKTDWESLAEDFVEAKAYFSVAETALRTTTRVKSAQHASNLLSLARRTFRDGDYREAEWIAKQALLELDRDPGKVHIPTRLLSPWEKAALFLSWVRREIFPRRSA